MNLELPKPPIGLAQDPDTWVYLPAKQELNELAYELGPQRTAATLNDTSNYPNGKFTDIAADILGLGLEAHTMDYVGYDPFDPAHIWVHPTAPPVEDADFGGIYEVKRTNGERTSPKYRVEGNADHIIVHGLEDATVNGDHVIIHGFWLIGWYQPRADHAYSKFAGYDSKGRELRSIPTVRRRPMDTMPILVGAS